MKVWFFVLSIIASVYAFPIQFEAGLLTGREAPLSLVGGVRLFNAEFRAEGLGVLKKKDDCWGNVRGSFFYRFFGELPFSFAPGVSVGYFYAKAPNERNATFNAANHSNFLREFNEIEYFDTSVSFDARLFGLFTTLHFPFAHFRAVKKPRIIWSLGYLFEF